MDRITEFLSGINSTAPTTPAEEAIFFSTEKSQGKAIMNFQQMDKAIQLWLETHQKEYDVLVAWLAEIPKADNNDDAQLVVARKYIQMWNECSTITNRQIKDFDKLFDKNAGSRILQRADLKQENVQSAELELVKKCQTGGTYRKQADTLAEKYASLYTKAEALANRIRDEASRGRGLATWIPRYNHSTHNLVATVKGSMNRGVLRMESKKPFPVSGEDTGKATESFSDFIKDFWPAD